MRKNIVIIILIVVVVMSLGYGIIQKQRADGLEAVAQEQTRIAQEQGRIATEAHREANKQRIRANIAAQMALGEASWASKQVKKAKEENKLNYSSCSELTGLAIAAFMD